MKLTKETLKRIIKEELEAVQQEGFMDSVKGMFGFGGEKEKTQEPSPQQWPSAQLSNLMGIVWDEDKYPNIPKEVASLAAEIHLYGMGPEKRPGANKDLQSALAKLKQESGEDSLIQADLKSWSRDAYNFMSGEGEPRTDIKPEPKRTRTRRRRRGANAALFEGE